MCTHGAQNGLNAVEVSQCSLCILAFHLFSRHISRMQSFQQNRQFKFHALVVLKILVSLISRLVACSPRIVVDKQTHTQNDYVYVDYVIIGDYSCNCIDKLNEKAHTFV